MEQTLFKIALINTSGGSNKFWNASIGNESFNDGHRPAYLAKYGTIGSLGTPNRQTKGSHTANWKFLRKKILEKMKRGYVFDPRNTSKHFMVPGNFIDGERFTEKQIAETKILAQTIKTFCTASFDHSINVIYKGEDEIREIPKEDIKPQKTGNGLKAMLSQRKKEAKFEL